MGIDKINNSDVYITNKDKQHRLKRGGYYMHRIERKYINQKDYLFNESQEY
jgi:hypothetical protein